MISQNCHTLNQIKPCDNLTLKSNFFDSKPKLSQGLILADILAHVYVKIASRKEMKEMKEKKCESDDFKR